MVVTSSIDLQIAPSTTVSASAMAKAQFTQILDMTADELEHFMETGRPHPRKVAAGHRAGKSGP
ncbi:MAG: hypothetical protein AAFY88_16265 [Acidobacteriota bacterium]